MELHATMNAQEWKALLEILVANGITITDIPKTDTDGLFVDFKYAIVEYNGNFYTLHGNYNTVYPFEVTRYAKVSPYEKRQTAYPKVVHDVFELIDYMKEDGSNRPLKSTSNQWLFLDLLKIYDNHSVIWHLKNEIAGWREKHILDNLASISTTLHTEDYHVLRFHSADGDYFDFETKSRRITG